MHPQWDIIAVTGAWQVECTFLHVNHSSPALPCVRRNIPLSNLKIQAKATVYFRDKCLWKLKISMLAKFVMLLFEDPKFKKMKFLKILGLYFQRNLSIRKTFLVS